MDPGQKELSERIFSGLMKRLSDEAKALYLVPQRWDVVSSASFILTSSSSLLIEEEHSDVKATSGLESL